VAAGFGLSLALALTLGCTVTLGGSESATTSSSSTNPTNSTSESGSASETDPSTSGKTSTGTESSSITANISGSDATTDGTTGTGTTEGTTGTTGDVIEWCNYFEEICPEGTKCTFDNSSSEVQCAPIVRDPAQLGDPCDPGEGGTFDGFDNCDDELLCLGEDADDAICVPFCGPDIDNFDCPSGMACSTCQTCALGICIPICDPLGDDCGEGQTCVPGNGPDFQCAVDASEEEGQYGDPCEFVNVCDPKLVCLDKDYVPDCESNGCCTNFCDLGDPQCPDDALECTPWFEEEAPEGLEHVGVCILPMP